MAQERGELGNNFEAMWNTTYHQNVPAVLRYAGHSYKALKQGSEASVAFCDWVLVNDDRLRMGWTPPWDINDPSNSENWEIRAKRIIQNIWQTLGEHHRLAVLRAGDDISITRNLVRNLGGFFELDPIETQLLELITRDNTDISVAALFGWLVYTPHSLRPLKPDWVFALLLGISEDTIRLVFQKQPKLFENGLLVVSQNPEVLPKSTLADLVRQTEFVLYGSPPEPAPLDIPGDWPDWDC